MSRALAAPLKASRTTSEYDHCVSFPMFETIRVNGRSRDPLYAELVKHPDDPEIVARIEEALPH